MNTPVQFSLNDAQVARFNAKINLNNETQCWEWNAATSKTGYGLFNVNGVMRLAHRVAYQISNGSIPDELCVCHKCDNPKCCNPSHLWAGTVIENLKDMRVKKREARGETHGLVKAPWKAAHGDNNGARKYIERMPRGEANPGAKLNAASVIEIRSMRASGDFTMDVIANKFGVSRANVIAIVKRKTWAHIP